MAAGGMKEDAAFKECADQTISAKKFKPGENSQCRWHGQSGHKFLAPWRSQILQVCLSLLNFRSGNRPNLDPWSKYYVRGYNPPCT